MDEALSPARIVAVIPSLIVDRLSGVLEVARVTHWDTLEGFDSAFQFTFEDADFVRRAVEVGATFERVSDVEVHHAHSQTSRLIDTVLPVSAWASYDYPRKWESSQATAKVVCVVALALRTIMVLFVSVPKRQRLRGIRRGIWHILRDSPPPLLRYEDM